MRSASRWQAGRGELVLLVETGFVPPLGQVRFDFPVFRHTDYADRDRWGWSLYGHQGDYGAWSAGREIEYWISVAAPELQDQAAPPYAGVRASVGTGAVHAVGTKASDLGRAARVTFDAEKPTIFVRTILRGLAKYLASRGAAEAGKGLGQLVNLLGAVTERADTRSWLTLPGQIHVLRLPLPPGTHDVTVELLGADGRVAAERTLTGLTVRPGSWTFESRRVF